jgi:hypothetical protein
MSRRHAARPRRLDVGALVPCHQVLRGLAALLGLEVPWAFPGEARHCCLRHWFQNGAKTTDARPAPTAIVFWQRGRVHNHQARGRREFGLRGQRRGTESDKGTAANSLSGYHAPMSSEDVTARAQSSSVRRPRTRRAESELVTNATTSGFWLKSFGF